jgi:hypothetical protein
MLLLSPLGPLINKRTSKQTFDRSLSAVFGPSTKPVPQELDGFWQSINYNDEKHGFHNLIRYMTDRKMHRARWVSAF